MRSVLLVALVAVTAVAGNINNQNSPCQFVTEAVIGNTTQQSTADQFTAMKQFVTDAATGGLAKVGSGSGNNTATTTGLFAADLTKDFFNGKNDFRNANPNGNGTNVSPFRGTTTPTFSGASATPGATADLVAKLAKFFAPAFGCNSDFEKYTPAAAPAGTSNTQRGFHSGMGISKAVMDAFNAELAATATSAKYKLDTANSAFMPAIVATLQQFNRATAPLNTDNSICNQASCDCGKDDKGVQATPPNVCNTRPSGTNSASSASFSFAGLVALAAAALALKQ